MEVCVPIKTSLRKEISCNRGSVIGPRNPSHCVSRNLSVDDLERCLSQYLSIEDNKISTTGCDLKPTKNIAVNLVREEECEHLDDSTSSDSSPENGISKCATFLPMGESKSIVDRSSSEEKELEDNKAAEVSVTDECAESADHSRSVSLPTPVKPVSAMKGSREKQGVEPKKLSVTWAPDVYDPVPTSVSHVPSNKHHRHRSDSKKYAKSKHRSSSSKSSRSKSKDKKQPRKSSGSSTSKLKPLQYINGVAGFGEFQVGMLEDYNDASLDPDDPFCGSSFLNKSVSKLQFTAA